tara:strand:+ start:19668 stop:20819 length:1152 start_codon:yes stop_codon:yes gene_type:complete
MDFDNTQAINELIANPPPLKPVATTQKWNAWTAPLRAVAAGVAEMAGTLSSVQPQMDANRPMPEILLEEQRRWQQRYGDRTESQVMRDVARDLRPDPNTAGVAENIVFGLGRGLTKGALYLGAGGPILGAAAFGVDEGATTMADLQQQGVDANTALKAGVAAGVGGTVGLALPMAGSTVGRTVGLWAVGGPGAFVAQQAATQKILRDADYGRIAESYDPLDPVGLAVAALVPGVFAGLHIRGLRRPGEAAPTPEAAPPRPAVDLDAVDAAMTHNLTAQADALAKLPPETLPDDAPLPGPVAKLKPEPEQGLTPEAARPAAEQAIDLQTVSPDLPVRVSDDGRLVTVDEEMNAVRQDARNGSDFELGHDDAPLLQVAAECFLTL